MLRVLISAVLTGVLFAGVCSLAIASAHHADWSSAQLGELLLAALVFQAARRVP